MWSLSGSAVYQIPFDMLRVNIKLQALTDVIIDACPDINTVVVHVSNHTFTKTV